MKWSIFYLESLGDARKYNSATSALYAAISPTIPDNGNQTKRLVKAEINREESKITASPSGTII